MHPGLKGSIIEEELAIHSDNLALENILACAFFFCFKLFISAEEC
jgi:hypothetical protein